MPAINDKWMEEFLRNRLEGSPIKVEVIEDEFFHPKPYTLYTINFTFSALKHDNTWGSATSHFAVRDDGLLEEKADEIFESYFNKVMHQYREFVGNTMGFTKYAKELFQRFNDCQDQLKEEQETTLKAIKHGNRRHKRT